jgi:serine/threonine protein kinase
MTGERWQEIRTVLETALPMDSEKRRAYLDQACASDQSLRREVESLLAADKQARTGFLESPPLARKLEKGTRLGDCEIQSLLGAGGMGEVYRARDLRLRRDVAVKVLPAVVSSDPERLRRFEQEATAAAALNHPNILAVHQLGTYAGIPYLVSELLEGETLRQQILRGRFAPRRVVDYGVQIAHGLAAAHEKGVVHRDLKPENLFITKDGRVKILDFGLAKLTQAHPGSEPSAPTIGGETEPGLVMGTVGYMSPEQVRGQAVDSRGDIFAFGAILYEMLTGKRAFQKPTSPETMSAILNEDPPEISQVVPNLPFSLQRVVRRCLDKNPERRFQSTTDLAFALDALSDSTGSVTAVTPVKRRRVTMWGAAALVLLVLAAIVATLFWLRMQAKTTDNSTWTQITNLPDSVSQPALSPDGRMLTFVRGPATFAGPGQIYVKMLPDGEAVQLTYDGSQKMSPVFSPDGSRIAYTSVDFKNWDTWLVPLLGSHPHLWFPNASGLTWIDKGKILFSEIKDSDVHMAIVSANESRAEQHDVYVPPGSRAMAHRSRPSPDGKWALIVEMDRGEWLACKLVALDGRSAVKTVGPAEGGCTEVAWSNDGRWMYFTSAASGAFHIWRQRFPDGRPEQVTSGPSEEEGIAMAPDGRSFITAVGSRQSSVWIHVKNDTRQLSLEGFSFDPKFIPDGTRLCYRILRGSLPDSDPSDLRIVDLASGRQESVLPDFAVVGVPHTTYDMSPDGRQLVVSADRQGKHRLWLVSLDRQIRPHEIPNVEGTEPFYGPGGEIFFRGLDGNTAYAYRVHEDGTGLRKVFDQPIAVLRGISPDGQWLVAKIPGPKGSTFGALPVRQSLPVRTIATAAVGQNDNEVYWSGDRKTMYIRVPESYGLWAGARTYALPLPAGNIWPKIPAGGFQSEAEMAKFPGAVLLNEFDSPGPASDVYAFSRMTAQRNLFRIPLR